MLNLVGHSKVKLLLSNMLESQKLPSAFLFYGEAGVGKKSFARAFARELVQGKKESHPDIRIYSLDEKSSLHTISSMRELKEEVYLPPFESKHKVFILEDAHKMVLSSSQSLLKTLEEPSPYCKIILITESINDLLPTIVSRCCKIAFSPLKEEEIKEFLIKEKSLNEEPATSIAASSFGSLERALSFINEEERKWQETLLDLALQFQTLSSDASQEKFSFLEKQLEEKKSCSIENIYETLLRVIRDIVVLKEGLSSHLLFFKNKEEALKVASESILLSFDAMEKLWQEAKSSVTYHIKPKVALETLLIRLYE